MKNYKLIPLLAVSIFLAGCNVTKGAKAPSFAKLGNEVEYADWIEQFNQPDLLGAWSNPSEQHIPSVVATIKQYGYQKTKIVSNKKVVESENDEGSQTGTFKTDMNNLRLSIAMEEKSSSERKLENRVIKQSENQKYDVSVQIGKAQVGDEQQDCILNIDNRGKQYSIMTPAGSLDAQQRKTAFENLVMSFFSNAIFPSSFGNILENYPNMTVEQQSKYKFYVNGKIFTIVSSDSFAELGDFSGTIVNSLTKVETSEKYQLDATKGESFKFKSASEAVFETEYLGDFYDNNTYVTRKIGDKGEGKYAEYYDVDFKAQDVKLNEVDLSNYTFIS